jgi:hypothetical protein
MREGHGITISVRETDRSDLAHYFSDLEDGIYTCISPAPADAEEPYGLGLDSYTLEPGMYGGST